jgi:hypothetical protein
MPPEVLEARIALRVARLRLLAAWTAVAVGNPNDPPPAPCTDVDGFLAATEPAKRSPVPLIPVGRARGAPSSK